MLDVIPFATAELHVTRRHAIGATPRGMRTIGEVHDACITGERLRAQQVGVAAADWATTREDGVTEVDVRLTLQTHDGALVYMRYDGYLDPQRGAFPILSVMRFEVSDARYAWLNRLLAVGKGSFVDGVVHYQIHELR